MLETLPHVEAGFVCSVQACAATSAGASRRGPPPPCPPSLTRLEGRGEIWGPVPQQGHLEKQAALSFLPCRPLPPASPGASLISRRKLCSSESYLSPSPSRARGPLSGPGKGGEGRRAGSRTPQRLWSSQPFSPTPRLGASRPLPRPARACPPTPPCPPPFHPALVSRQLHTCDSCTYYWFGVVSSVFFLIK